MAKYKLTVKYNSVCDLSIAGDLPDIIANEFDQYVKSMLYKREEWENFEANFKLAAKKEYGNIKRAKREEPKKEESRREEARRAREEARAKALDERKQNAISASRSLVEASPKPAMEPEIKEELTDLEELAKNSKLNAPDEAKEDTKPDIISDLADTKEETPKEEIKKEAPKKQTIISFGEYIENKNINTPLDEFVAGACYLDKILNVKEFSLKQLNAKLYPAFGRLASSGVIDEAVKRVLIEIIQEGAHQRYKINENAWNYHNYDLVRHE